MSVKVLKNVLRASPKSDGHIISPYNINRFLIRQVMRITRNIALMYLHILKTNTN